MVMKEEMLTEENPVINELEQGKELAIRLMNNFKFPSPKESNKFLISGIVRSFENATLMFNLDMKRSSERMEQSTKKRKTMEKKKKKTEKMKICVETGQEGASLEDGFCWRKYGQKYINGSKNPRGYYRCTHRFTQGCLAVKQVQRTDEDPSCYEVKYVENHTCNINLSTTKRSVSSFKQEGDKVLKKLHVPDQPEDIFKHVKSEEVVLSLDDLEKKKEIFRTFSFSNPETENVHEWTNLTPTRTSESGITNELLSASSASVPNSPTDDDSCFSSLENIIDLTYDWSCL